MPVTSNPTSLVDAWTRIWQTGILQFSDWLNFMGPFTVGGMFNTVNINSKSSADPEVEQDVTQNVASYGRQLGRITDALLVVLDEAKLPGLSFEQQRALAEFRDLAAKIAAVKKVHEAKKLGIPVSEREPLEMMGQRKDPAWGKKNGRPSRRREIAERAAKRRRH